MTSHVPAYRKLQRHLSVEAAETEDSPPQSPAFEELLEVVTRAVAKLNIEWPSEKGKKGRFILGSKENGYGMMPRVEESRGAAARDQPHMSVVSSSLLQQQKESVASHAPPQRAWGTRQQSQPKSSKPKTDLRAVIQARKASGKRS
ncbi:hypothetical protein DPX16_20029 [Anabarilius grahami]|uniref:Uncharacterized protein n=1 Tax=Anabarilius grahami TaxID=495550 RepID=A0A3N0Z4S2_ANAGA|nr:hypothetical protein DPX16_20029 [Anabarilius grahami]